MNKKKEGVSFAGDYLLEEFSILKADSDFAFDIKNQLQSFFLYEDMFSPFTSGSAVLRDTIDLLNLFGRGGKNLIRIKVTTPSLKSIEGYFHLYKISDRSEVAERAMIYTLNFISEESLSDLSLHISKKFSGLPSDIASKICKDYLKTTKKINTTSTTNSIAYVSNFWSATENLVYLTDHSVARGKISDYLFFENRDGFNFISAETIRETAPIQTFSRSDYTTSPRNEGDTSIVRDFNQEYKQIQEITVGNLYDFMVDMEEGGLHNRVIFSDIVRKKYSVKDYSLMSDERKTLNPNKLYSDDVIKSVRTKIMRANRHYGVHSKGDQSNASFFSNRIMHLTMLKGQVVEIKVMGRVDYTVGKKVNLNLNQIKNITKDMTKDEITDKMLSGDYIITAIMHKFDGKAHSCQIELMKDSTLST